MNFGGRTNEAEAIEIIHQAIDAGINFIDTANVYGHDPAKFDFGRGRSEEIVGRALKQNGKRDRVILATKAHFPMGDDPNAQGNSRRHVLDQCAASLHRLQTDYIDLYQLHSVSPEIPIDETLRALDDLIRRGWIRYIGTSGFAAWQIMEALWASKEYGLNRFISEQAPYNLLDRRIERELAPMARTYGIAILTWSPLAGGFLAGKYRRGEPVPAESRFEVFWRGWWREHLTDVAFDITEQIERHSKEKDCTPTQLALAWYLRRPGITSIIIGPRTRAHLEDNLGALNVSMTEEDIERINALAPPGLVAVPYYKQEGWRPHNIRW
jgi:aryl-alcohol dehydrogenase-like predicted oxidoreductase